MEAGVIVLALIVAVLVFALGREFRRPEKEPDTSERDNALAALNDSQLRTAKLEEGERRQEQRIRELEAERGDALADVQRLNQQNADLQVELGNARTESKANQQAFESYRKQLLDQFTGIAANVTESTREQFIKEFGSLTEQHSARNQEALEGMLKPMRERLTDLEKYGGRVEGGVTRLLEETSGLRRILHNPGKRGDWGEQHLRNVMQAAGMTDHVDFVEQERLQGDGKSLRPDVVVQIPGGIQVVVDAKTPFENYDKGVREDDNDVRSRLFADHARDLLRHARTLKGRDYSNWVDSSPDFVVMYVPTDPMLDVAIEANSEVWQEAWDRHRVLIATPGLLIAFLRTVALAWQQQAIQQNAQDIADSARELYDRLGTYTGHIISLGNQLGTVVNTYNKSVGSFQSRVLPQARRIEELSEIEESRRFEEPDAVLTDIRELQAPEVHEPEFEALEAGD